MPGRREIYDRHFGLSTVILMFAKFVDEPPSPCRLEKSFFPLHQSRQWKIFNAQCGWLEQLFPLCHSPHEIRMARDILARCIRRNFSGQQRHGHAGRGGRKLRTGRVGFVVMIRDAFVLAGIHSLFDLEFLQIHWFAPPIVLRHDVAQLIRT